MKFKTQLSLFFIYFLFSIFYSLSYADTIQTKDGKELKGIVVEDYKDRLVFSTADGEITVAKSDINELYFDSEEENLIKLAEQMKERREFGKSYTYYNMALKLDPNSKAAQDGIVFLQGYLFRQEQVKKEDEVKRRDDFERYGTIIETEKTREEKLKISAEALKKNIGISIVEESGMPVISSVQKNSPASDAGIKTGDRLVAIWSRLTGYMPILDVMNALLDKPSLELKCTIERTVDVDVKANRVLAFGPNELIGASFAMEFDGLTVSAVKEGGASYAAGLKKGDLITAIDGKSTRYLPLKKAAGLIKDSKGNFVKLTLRREVLIWRRD